MAQSLSCRDIFLDGGALVTLLYPPTWPTSATRWARLGQFVEGKRSNDMIGEEIQALPRKINHVINRTLEIEDLEIIFTGAGSWRLYYSLLLSTGLRFFWEIQDPLFVGFIVGSLSVIYGVGNGDAHLFTQPVLVLALPVLDVLYVMAFRISRNRNPFLADRNHIHHVLLRRGIPGIYVVLIIYIMTLSFCVLASLSTTLPNWLTILLFFSLSFLTILLPRLQPT